MLEFNTKVECADEKDEDKNFHFECYENTEPIEIGDIFIFFFAGIADVQTCYGENQKEEINPNNRKSTGLGDLVTGFWMNCYKIKETNFKLPKDY